jgi:predicted HicB family RNase H-like nuclease
MERKTKKFPLRLPEDMHKELVDAARDEFGSLHTLIMRILAQYLKERRQRKMDD